MMKEKKRETLNTVKEKITSLHEHIKIFESLIAW